MFLLQLFFPNKSSPVPRGPSYKRLKNFPDENTTRRLNSDRRQKCSEMTPSQEECCDADCIRRAQSSKRYFIRRDGLCGSKMLEDIQMLRRKLLEQALTEAHMI